MLHALLADLVMVVHFAFVLFVALGALLVLRWPRVARVHVPCALYGAALEFLAWTCPLTPLEKSLRRTAGQDGWEEGFIQHYLEGVLYPTGWGDLRIALGVAVLVGNGLLYGWILLRRRRGAPVRRR